MVFSGYDVSAGDPPGAVEGAATADAAVQSAAGPTVAVRNEELLVRAVSPTAGDGLRVELHGLRTAPMHRSGCRRTSPVPVSRERGKPTWNCAAPGQRRGRGRPMSDVRPTLTKSSATKEQG